MLDLQPVALGTATLATFALLIAICSTPTSAFSNVVPPNVQHQTHNATTSGGSGEVCTPIGRKCLTNASCTNHECVCPAGQKGNAMVECVEQDEHLCTITADPHLKTFGGDYASVDLQCRYRAARLQAKPHCGMEVHVTNELHRGRYYARAIDISVGVFHITDQATHVVETRKFGVSEEDIYRYSSNVSHTTTVWGSSTHETIRGLDVFLTFDEANNFATLEIPECEMRVKFRTYDKSLSTQPLMPGVTIMAPADSTFVDEEDQYPSSLCGTSSDDERFLENRASILGLGKDLMIVYDILNNLDNQTGNPMGPQCESASRSLSNINDSDQVGAMKECGPLVTDYQTRNCASNAGTEPIVALGACLSYKASEDATACQLVSDLATACQDHGWAGPNFSCSISQNGER